MEVDSGDAAGTCGRDIRVTFVLLWVFVLFNYTYADIGMVFMILSRPELMERVQGGLVGSARLSDGLFLGGAMLMEIAFAMVLLSWRLRRRANRIANVAAGTLFTLVILFTLFGAMRVPPLNFYTFFQVIEIGTTSTIVWLAWRWRPSGADDG